MFEALHLGVLKDYVWDFLGESILSVGYIFHLCLYRGKVHSIPRVEEMYE